MAVRTRPPPEGPRAGGNGGKLKKPQACEVAAWLRKTAEGRRPHKFPRPDWGEARKPPPPACAGPAQGKRGLRPPRAPHPGSRGSRKKKTRPFLSPPHRRAPKGRGAGGGARRRAAPSQPRICFHFRPHSGEDAGRCSFASGRKSACGGRGRADRPTRGRCLGGTRTTSPYSAGAAAAGSRLPASQAPRPPAGRGCPRADARRPARAAPPARPPTAPRSSESCARPACVELPGTPRRLGRPFVYSQTEGAPVCSPPPSLF